MIKHDNNAFDYLKKEYQSSGISPSGFWDQYVQDICKEINENGFKNYGSNYKLTYGGFGDTPKITPRPLFRKILKLPVLYRFFEKKYVYFVINRVKKTFFHNLINDDFSKKELLIHLAEKLHDKTIKSRLVRKVDVNQKEIPHSYTKGAIYLDIIEKIISFNNLEINIKNLFNSNVIDIGGGIGSILHSFYEYNILNDINPQSSFVLLDQFPVSYIAKQSLEYFTDSEVLILDKTNDNTLKKGKLHIMQNTSSSELRNMDFSLFFNSSSFQEMDEKHVFEYCEFIEKNASDESYLACFLYPSNQEKNSDKAVVKILNNRFTLLGWDKNYFDKYRGGTSGILYLYKVK